MIFNSYMLVSPIVMSFSNWTWTARYDLSDCHEVDVGSACKVRKVVANAETHPLDLDVSHSLVDFMPCSSHVHLIFGKFGGFSHGLPSHLWWMFHEFPHFPMVFPWFSDDVRSLAFGPSKQMRRTPPVRTRTSKSSLVSSFCDRDGPYMVYMIYVIIWWYMS